MQIDKRENEEEKARERERAQNVELSFAERTKVRMINCVERKTMQNYVRI